MSIVEVIARKVCQNMQSRGESDAIIQGAMESAFGVIHNPENAVLVNEDILNLVSCIQHIHSFNLAH
jgi:hypothetical protein